MCADVPRGALILGGPDPVFRPTIQSGKEHSSLSGRRLDVVLGLCANIRPLSAQDKKVTLINSSDRTEESTVVVPVQRQRKKGLQGVCTGVNLLQCPRLVG